jgi:outer membrane protein OmpA-like peptidoglycan-associated protein
MRRTLNLALLAGLGLAVPIAAFAQGASTPPEGLRPATTTIYGDTGLWFLSTGEILPAGRWSVSAYRVNYDREQGFSDISTWPVTFGVGVRDRAEIFGSVRLVNRVDRDIRPLFTSDPGSGGFVQDVPFVHEGWTGNVFGSFYLGAKVNLLSEYEQDPAAFAIRGMVKIPTEDDAAGGGTGKMDFLIDAIFSKDIQQRVELAANAGFAFRGAPDEVEISNSFTWGIGAGFPSRRALRLQTELRGELMFDDQLTGAPFAGMPPISFNSSTADASIGVTWQHRNGFFAGAGLNWAINTSGRDGFGNFENVGGDSLGFQARLGYHPGVRIYVPPPPPAPPAPPPAPPAAPDHQLSVKAQCNPCTVEVGRTSTVTATAQSSIKCAVTYRWTAPTGTFATPTAAQSVWTAPGQEGAVPVTVTVVCPSDNRTATDTITIQVVRPAAKTYTFEDVHFDFDRYTLRPDATRVLDEAIAALKQDPALRLEVEGHTCNIGTAEYNIALGDRRASAVRDYLSSRGIGADRLRTVSYGEERPKHDNSREETRRLNRRAAMVVRLQ